MTKPYGANSIHAYPRAKNKRPFIEKAFLKLTANKKNAPALKAAGDFPEERKGDRLLFEGTLKA